MQCKKKKRKTMEIKKSIKLYYEKVHSNEKINLVCTLIILHLEKKL